MPDTPPRRRSIRLPGYDYAQPGMYFVDGFAVELSITLPAGWIVSGFDRNSFAVESSEDGKNNIAFIVIDRAYGDPCHPSAGGETSFTVGSTIPTDQRVDAFSAMKGFEVNDVRSTIVQGLLC